MVYMSGNLKDNPSFEKIFSELNCIACNKKTLEIMQRISNIPYFGEIFETITLCKSCGFKNSTILCLEQKEPIYIEFKIEEEKDLEARVIKSQNCIVEIPELGIKIEPCTASEGYVANVESVLFRIKETLFGIKNKKSQEIIKKIDDCTDGKLSLTLIFQDKSGLSDILSPKTIRKILNTKKN